MVNVPRGTSVGREGLCQCPGAIVPRGTLIAPESIPPSGCSEITANAIPRTVSY